MNHHTRIVMLLILVWSGIGANSRSASAATIHWTLSGVTFNDGGTASGSFAIDTDLGRVVDLTIDTTKGSCSNNCVNGYHYTMAEYSGGGTQSFSLYDWAHDQNYFSLTFDRPLTSYGTTAYFHPSSTSWEGFIGGPSRFVTSGSAISDPAPVPCQFDGQIVQVITVPGAAPSMLYFRTEALAPVYFSAITNDATFIGTALRALQTQTAVVLEGTVRPCPAVTEGGNIGLLHLLTVNP